MAGQESIVTRIVLHDRIWEKTICPHCTSNFWLVKLIDHNTIKNATLIITYHVSF